MGATRSIRTRAFRRYASVLLVVSCLVAVSLQVQPASGAPITCESFPNQAKAQTHFLSNGGPLIDAAGLDSDNNGIACDGRPAPYRGFLTLTHTGTAFSGALATRSVSCLQRNVAVYKLRKGDPPKRIGTAALDERGEYSIPTTLTRGKFVAKIAKSRGCAAEISISVTVPQTKRLEIDQDDLFFDDNDQTRPLTASFVDDATGNTTQANNVWFWSANTDNFTVTRNGALTSIAKDGSAKIVATAEGITSAPALAVVASVPDEAIRVTDAQLESGPLSTDPGAEPSFSSTFTAVLDDVDPPEVGQLHISTGRNALVGRVVSFREHSVRRYEVVYSQVPVAQAFPNLTLDESIQLGTGPVAVAPATARHFKVSRRGTTHTFTQRSADRRWTASSEDDEEGPCTFSVGTSAPLTFDPVKATFTIDPRMQLTMIEGRLVRSVVTADPVVTLEGGFKVEAAFESEVECEFEIVEFQRPAPGPLGFVIGGQVPFSIVLTAGGKLTLASAKVTARTAVKSHAVGGIDCLNAPPCQLISQLESEDPKSTIEVSTQNPLNGVRFEPTFSGVVRMAPSIGAHQVKDARITLANFDAGAKLSGKFGSIQDQVDDFDFASAYGMVLTGGVTVAPQLNDLLKKFNLEEIDWNEFQLPEKPLGASPTGRVKASKYFFRAGDKVNFAVNLDQTRFFNCCGPYNVDSVVLVRKLPTTGEVVEVKRVTAKNGQRSFDIGWTADGFASHHEFWAFVVTRLVPYVELPLEIGQATAEFSCSPARGDYDTDC